VRAEPPRAEPFRLEPIFHHRIWGALSLAPLFPQKHDLPEPIGEAWLTSLDCLIANGPYLGQTLGQAWKDMTVAWRGSEFQNDDNFPLLVKFIFPKDKLSIQVHPDDAYAAAHEAAAGGRGKTEMWHVVSAAPGARLLAGLKPGVTKEIFRAALASKTLEDLFQSHEVHAGDTFFLPAGTPHTIGPNMVICEVQQYSDLTYRVYDYDRTDVNGKPRELHVEKALEVLAFNSSVQPKVTTSSQFIREKKFSEELVACPYFVVSRFDIQERAHLSMRPADRFKLWVFLEGEGKIGWTSAGHSTLGEFYSGEFSYKQGECWFIPAEFGSYSYYPEKKTSILIATPGNGKRV
jgi:mannose-6-phosphate isomerase